MLRPSIFLKRMREVIQPHADAGTSIPAEVVPTMCGFLRMLATECERMEVRLVTLEIGDAQDGTVVSLSAWAGRKGGGV